MLFCHVSNKDLLKDTIINFLIIVIPNKFENFALLLDLSIWHG